MTKNQFIIIVGGGLLALASGCAEYPRRDASYAPSNEEAAADSSGAPNAALAFDPKTGECVPYKAGARKIDYDACVAIRDSGKARGGESGTAAPAAAAPATVASVAGVPAATTPTFAVPTGNGPICESAPGTRIEITNASDYSVEVQSAYMVPLNCDAWATTGVIGVARKDGMAAMTRVVGPHTMLSLWTYAFAMNGPIPQLPKTVSATFVAYINMGPTVLGPYRGSFTRQWQPRQHDVARIGIMNEDFISYSLNDVPSVKSPVQIELLPRAPTDEVSSLIASIERKPSMLDGILK